MNIENPDKLPLWAEFTPVPDSPTEITPRSDFHLNATDSLHADEADHATTADSATNADHADDADTATLAGTAQALDTTDLPSLGGFQIANVDMEMLGTAGVLGGISINDTLGKVLAYGLFHNLFTPTTFAKGYRINTTNTDIYDIKTSLIGSYLCAAYKRAATNYFYAVYFDGSTWSAPVTIYNSVAISQPVICESPNYAWFACVRNSDNYLLGGSGNKTTGPGVTFSVVLSTAVGYLEMVYYNSYIYIIYRRNSDNKTYYIRRTEGGAWSAETLVTADTIYYWKSAVVFNGLLYLISKKSDNKLYYYTFDGTTWSSSTVIDNVLTFPSSTIGTTLWKSELLICCQGSSFGCPAFYSINTSNVVSAKSFNGLLTNSISYIDIEAYNNELYFIESRSYSADGTGQLTAFNTNREFVYPQFPIVGIISEGSNQYGTWWKLNNGLVIQLAITQEAARTFSASGSSYSCAVNVYLPYPLQHAAYIHFDSAWSSDDSDGVWTGQGSDRYKYATYYIAYLWQFGSTTNNYGMWSLIIGYDV